MSTQKVNPGSGPVAQPAAPKNANPNQGTSPIRPTTPAQPKANPAAPKPAAATPKPTVVTIAPPANRAKLERRHGLIAVLFALIVVVPVGLWAAYLYQRAEDQFVSTVGFSVRTEEAQSPLDILGGLGSLSGSGSRDADILYEFIQSQIMVQTIDAQLDLRKLFSIPETDPIFSFDPEGSIEDLVKYWQRMIRVNYDTGTQLIELQVRAFTPQDAQNIARAIFEENSRMINALSAIAREDTTRYAREELDKSIARLKIAREKMTQFRLQNQIADPETEIVVQTGLMNALQQRLSDALIELDLLSDIASKTDPRITLAQRKIDVIHARINDERRKFGSNPTGQGGEDFSTMIGEFESLIVDREFAEKSYLAALQAYDFALAEASRQSRYLAAYVKPTLAETALHPKRELLLGLAALFLFMIWAILTLVLYSIRDRR
ncbi:MULTISPECIES: hypothetical protein [Falsihalocynthiibacter]|uniref:hypothetical protein n=1 Tax=Falsihalocynthiibacter TaxID=2854182 RepID=UPI0030033AD2